MTTPGSREEHRRRSLAGADVTRGTELSDEACEVRAANAKRLQLISFARGKRWPDGWTPAMDAMLGTATDKEVSKLVGKSRAAVRARRVLLGIQAAKRVT